MRPSPRQAAECATFQAFAACYMREVAPGVAVRHRGAGETAADCVEWQLARHRLAVRAEVLARSLCGPHRFGRIWSRGLGDPVWSRTRPFVAITHLVEEIAGADEADVRDLDLLARILDSCRGTCDALCIGQKPAAADTVPDDSFIAAEQSLVFGHWMHPAPRSREGLSSWQAAAYAPDRGGRFRLRCFAARSETVVQDAAYGDSAAAIARALIGPEVDGLGLGADEILIPMHPLQADALMLDGAVRTAIDCGRLRPLGEAGPAFTATSSLRTVYSPERAHMAKFSLPVRITNSLRVNRRHELAAGVAIARLFARAGLDGATPGLTVLQDPAHLSVVLPGRCESGFEVIFRQNPFRHGAERGVAMVAALAADPLPGDYSRLHHLILGKAIADGDDPETTARRWFEAYLDCALDPLLRLYDEHGIALEAHQQNALLDVSAGLPSRSFYRDNQGYYLSNAHRRRLTGHVPDLATIDQLFFGDAEIADRFAYYLVVNQIFAVISRIAHDGLGSEPDLIERLRARLDHHAGRLGGVGRAFARGLLDRPTLAAKANLTLRIRGIDEVEAGGSGALTRPLPNPLARPAVADQTGGDHALAS